MHSIANLATLQTPLATFFPQKSAQTLFSLQESPVLPRQREVLLSQHTHTPLSLSLFSFYSAHAHTSLSLSLSASAQFLFSACAHTSPSLSASAEFLFSARTHISLCICSVSACGREEQSLIQLNTDIVACFSNCTC